MIILTSSVATVADHMYNNYLSQKPYQTVLFIDTAAELETGNEADDDDWLHADLTSLQNQNYQVDRWSVTDKTLDEIESKLDAYDIMYMCGGNTIYLLQQLQSTGSFGLIRKKVQAGKPYIGTSAGSIVAGPKIPVYLENPEGISLDDYTGFHFTNTIIVPHWGSEHFRKMYLEERLMMAYQATEPPFLLLSDFQYAVVTPDGKGLEVVNTIP